MFGQPVENVAPDRVFGVCRGLGRRHGVGAVAVAGKLRPFVTRLLLSGNSCLVSRASGMKDDGPDGRYCVAWRNLCDAHQKVSSDCGSGVSYSRELSVLVSQ